MRKQRVWVFLKVPPCWFLIATYLLTAFFVTGSVLALTLPTFPVYLGYVAYGAAAISLSYTVYTVIRFAPRMRRWLGDWIGQHEFTRDLKENFGFRTVVLAIGSFAMSIAYGIFHGVLSIRSLSVWYGALASYYILLALLRGGILYHHVKSGRLLETEAPCQTALRRAKTYRFCGILLLLLQMALSAAIAQMILDDKGFRYDAEWMIFAVAAYAFYKIITATVNFFKAKKHTDLTVEAIRNINLADATVSILALQTALLSTYGTDGMAVSHFHTATGSAVSLFTLGLGVFMIVKAQKQIKILKMEQTHGE